MDDDADLAALEALVAEWLTLPDVAQRLDVDVSTVRGLVRDQFLVAVRRGRPAVLSVPADLLNGTEVFAELPGTLTVLADAGFAQLEALRWLLTEEATLGGSPLSALRAGRKTEIRRRAQALAL